MDIVQIESWGHPHSQHVPFLCRRSLRTLEFWVDNLNPEFLFPELSKQNELFVQLMKALSTHLRPAPYPYGLLTLRLLGKLGGKNRRVLREPIDICDPKGFKDHVQQIEIECSWLESEKPRASFKSMDTTDEGESAPRVVSHSFPLPLPIERSVEVLKRVVMPQKYCASAASQTNQSDSSAPLKWKDSSRLWELEIEKIDLLPYCVDVIEETQRSQVEAAMTVLRSALTRMVGVEKSGLEFVDVLGKTQTGADGGGNLSPTEDDAFDIQTASSMLSFFNKDLEMVGLGLMLGCAIEFISEEALVFARGLLTNVFLTVTSHQKYFVRVDANGSSLHPRTIIKSDSGGESPSHREEPGCDILEEGLGSLKPFGYFEQQGPLLHTTNPMSINRSLAELLSQPSSRASEVGLSLLRHLLMLPEKLGTKEDEPDEKMSNTDGLDRGSLIYFENLLNALCEQCVSSDWNRRDGLYKGIILIVKTLGAEWSRKYEMEIMNVALFSVKSIPREMSIAAVNAFQFLVQACSGIYGHQKHFEHGDGNFVFDMLSVPSGGKDDQPSTKEKPTESPRDATQLNNPCDEVLQILITEMASTKQILR
jgi:hypothetical protein